MVGSCVVFIGFIAPNILKIQSQVTFPPICGTKNSKNLWKLSSKLEFGMFGVNTGKISTYLNPFGGLKESGLGREGSEEGLEPFLEKKFISWRMS